MSEPGAGTDVKAMKTKAVRMDEMVLVTFLCLNYYHLNSTLTCKLLLYVAYPP